MPIGYGGLAQGVNQGLSNVDQFGLRQREMANQDEELAHRRTQWQREDQQYQRGLARQETEDKLYSAAADDAMEKRKGVEAMKSFAASGWKDPTPIVAHINELYGPKSGYISFEPTDKDGNGILRHHDVNGNVATESMSTAHDLATLGEAAVQDPFALIDQNRKQQGEYAKLMLQNALNINQDAAKVKAEADAKNNAPLRGKDRYQISDGQAFDLQNGGQPVTDHRPKPGEVISAEGYPITVDAIGRDYVREYGRYDPMTGAFNVDPSNPPRETLDQYFNRRVAQPYQRNRNSVATHGLQTQQTPQSPVHDWREFMGGGSPQTTQTQPGMATQPQQQPQPLGLNIEGLKTPDQIAAQNYAQSPQGLAAQVSSDVQATPNRMAADSSAMRSRFGLASQATGQAAGDQYNKMASAITSVSSKIKRGEVPSKQELEDAWQLAQGQKNPPIPVDQIAAIYKKYYMGGK